MLAILVTVLGFVDPRARRNNSFKPNPFDFDDKTFDFLNKFFDQPYLQILPDDVHNLSIDIGLSQWYKYRMFVSKLLRSFREIRFEDLSLYFEEHYSFFGFNTNAYYKSRSYLNHRTTMNVYDPEVDDSGFTDGFEDKFKGADEEWFTQFGQGIFDQDSYNFKEILKFLSDIKTKFYVPFFRLDKTKIIKKNNKISSPDGRIVIEWSEEIEILNDSWILDAFYLLCILLLSGAISNTLFGSVCNIVIDNLIRIDIASIPGGFVKVFFKGIQDVAKLISTKTPRPKGSRKFVTSLFRKDVKGKKIKLLALPEWRELLPVEKARKRLPPSRPG
jgi:hypothetical protein